MTEEIKEILDKLSNRKQETLIQGLRECQLKDIEHPFITREEYIDKILDYITNLQQLYENALKVNQNENKYRTELESKYVLLQQENKRLTSLCVGHEKELRTKDIIIKQIRMEANDYESRCEKANTYINEEIKKIQEHQYSTGIRRLNKIQNILNRSDEK